MSSVRVCPGCKWEFPYVYRDKDCRFCHTLFNERFCGTCEELKTADDFYSYSPTRCKACCGKVTTQWDKDNPEKRKARDDRFIDVRRAAAEEKYQKLTTHADIPFKLLSEKDWLATCSFFNGCALCGSEHIEARQFFVQFHNGGRYAPWNIFPTCGSCAVIGRTVTNPFIWMDKRLGNPKVLAVINEERRERLMEFFIQQIEKVKNEGQS